MNLKNFEIHPTSELILTHIHRYLKLKDSDILAEASQPGDEWFIDAHDTYAWYVSIGAYKQPDKILELGVRYGYAGVALVKGVEAIGNVSPLYIGIDSEFDGIPSNEIARNNLLNVGAKASVIFPYSTKEVDKVVECAMDFGPFDIVHVDGDHSTAGVMNELEIAFRCVAADGWILVDDVDTIHVDETACAFADSRGIKPFYLPTFHRLMVLDLGAANAK